jgi:hypothetical protein
LHIVREPRAPIVARCACGEEFSEERWCELPDRAVQRDLDPAYDRELRRCWCGAPIGRPLADCQAAVDVRRPGWVCLGWDRLLRLVGMKR